MAKKLSLKKITVSNLGKDLQSKLKGGYPILSATDCDQCGGPTGGCTTPVTCATCPTDWKC